MSRRRLPVRPDLDQLKRQAKEFLRAVRSGDPAAVAEFHDHDPERREPEDATLSQIQFALARSYGALNWTRLIQAVQLASAIRQDDLESVDRLVRRNPNLLHESVLVRADSDWGPPMTYAANLGRDRIIRHLHGLGATDLESAGGRAAMQGNVETAKMVYELAGRPEVEEGVLCGPAYTLSAEGTALLLTLGARAHGGPGSPAEVVLQTDARNPEAKHTILEMYARDGLAFPDTPPMALHRGRIDLLEEHMGRDPDLLNRTFTHREIYPAELGCGDPLDATVGTPLGGTTLLHMAVEFNEMEIARWLLERGADANVRAAVGRSGFGGYTPLFNTVVSQPNFWMNLDRRCPPEAPFAELLLEHGADPNVRASLWKRLHPGHGDPERHDYREVTALSWGRRFHAPIFVNRVAMERIREAGGVE